MAHRWSDALLVMDANTEEAAGSRVAETLSAAGVLIRRLVFPKRQGLHADPEAVAAVQALVRDDRAVVAVGSGVLTDIARYAAHLADHSFVSVPTAASMDGYASSVAALQVEGVKVTYGARAPIGIFADPSIAAAAPEALTRSGIGDLLAKASAQVDWQAAHLLYGEPYDEAVAESVINPLRDTAHNVRPLLAGGVDAAAALLQGLVQSGVAMAMAGSSRPASGCEHHASHFWDLLAARGRRAHAPHGLQVGYATRFSMRLQRFAFGGAVTAPRRPHPALDPLGDEAREWLGKPTQELEAAVEEKQTLLAAVPDRWPRDAASWHAVQARIAPALERFEAVERALEAAGIPADAGFLGVDERTLRATFRYATRLRARYTTVDFLESQGLLDDALNRILPPAGSDR